MPTNNLTTPFARDGTTQRSYKFGGGANTITTKKGILDDLDPQFEPYSIGYLINAGGGDDSISGSDIGVPGSGVGDTLIGGTGSDTISGGLGDDTIFGGNEDGTDGGKGKDPVVSNTLYGEERFVFLNAGETFNGGDDTITAGNDVRNFLYGDIQSANGFDITSVFNFGDDRLIGGTGEDDFIGDSSSGGGTKTINGGLDTFVIGLSGGDDTIWDFHVVEYFDGTKNVGDTIELVGFNTMGITEFDDLALRWSKNSASFVVLDLDATIDGAGDTVTFLGVSEFDTLSESFVFTAIIV